MKRLLNPLIIFTSVSICALANAQTTPEESYKDGDFIVLEESSKDSLLSKRQKDAKLANRNPFSITQLRQNYILPYSYVSEPNNITIDGLGEEAIDRHEAKFQISIMMPLYLQADDLSGIYGGFTTVSFWQVYNTDASKPFRETNYEPEVFYQWAPEFKVFGYDFNMARIGINHMSNGQDGLKSRSWNRIFASILFSDVNTAYYFKTWYRIPEDPKTSPNDPTGDDNPDINDYYGRAELGFIYSFEKLKIYTQIRNNLSFSDNRSGITLNLIYPINDRYNVLLQYFNGYGDSLIDYNRHQNRIGIGVELRLI